MSSIGTALVDFLRSVERPGDFCVGGLREIFMPAIDVDGVGRIAFPLLPVQAEQLIGAASAAPYGRGEETLVDRDVRRTWQIDAERVRVGGRHWERTLTELVADAALGLGVDGPVVAELYKLLVYDAGSFFVDHRDTEKAPGMFATLAVVLPSTHGGGELVVRHLGREVVFDLRPEEPSEIGFSAFYADCVHEIRPLVSGCRVVLVYNLRFADRDNRLGPPDYRDEQARIVGLLRGWAGAEDEPDKLILPLEHAYTPAELSFGTLKGADAAVASVMVGATAEAGCELHLALASIEESGSASHTGYYGRRGRWSDEDEDEFEVDEVFDQHHRLSDWQRPDGSETALEVLPFEQDELCPPDAFEDLEPDEQYFHEATGNEGASFERTYRRAGLVLWPRVRRLAVLNQAGLAATLPHLEELAVRWETSGAGGETPLWREADELSGHMLRTWPRQSWRAEDDARPGRTLDALSRLKMPARIDEFLAGLSAEGHYSGADNEAIARAAALLPRERTTELLARIVARNAPGHLAGCGELLLRCVSAKTGPVGEPAEIASALLEVLPGDPAKRGEPDPWQRPKPVTSGFVVDLLTALSRIDAGAADRGLAARAIAHLLAWPRAYTADGVLVPAALAFAERPESAAWPAVRQLREACLEHLQRRIARPLQAPSDWARDNRVKCDCADCRGLGAFLIDPVERQWHLKAVQDRRSHVADSARNGRCDLDLTTVKRGSPHTLVATKNQATYEGLSKQRREDLEQMAALGG